MHERRRVVVGIDSSQGSRAALEYTTMHQLEANLADRWQPLAEPQVPAAR